MKAINLLIGMFAGVLVMFVVSTFSGMFWEDAAAQGFLGMLLSIIICGVIDFLERRKEDEKEGD